MAIAGLVAAYAVLAVLLLSINLTSLWHWWVKAAAIVLTIAFFAVSYQSLHGLMGWPTAQQLPPRFSLVWTMVSEPSSRANSPGAIYIWAAALDRYNVPSATPRSYRLPYSDLLARKVRTAQERREQGQEVMGVLADRPLPPDAVAARKDIKMGSAKKGEQNAAADTVPFMDDGTRIGFQDLPPVALPDKGPL